MTDKQQWLEQAREGEDVIILTGYDDAIIGIEDGSNRAVYDVSKIIQILTDQGMDLDDAREFYEFNILGAYVENGPILVDVYQ